MLKVEPRESEEEYWKAPHLVDETCVACTKVFFVEKEGLKRPERLNCYNWQFIYIQIKSPLLRLDWLEGKTKTKMTFEFEVFENIRNAMPLTTCTHFLFTDIVS